MLLQLFDRLNEHYDVQAPWWPAQSAFEMMVGAVLTQNTRWENVQMALNNLRNLALLAPATMLASENETLQMAIRPTGFFKQKSATLHRLCAHLLHTEGENFDRPLAQKRQEWLSIKGIGPETADSILLYGYQQPIFVIDAYTLRIFKRLGRFEPSVRYAQAQAWMMQQLPNEVALFQCFHGLIVEHAKAHCRKQPCCQGCPLQSECAYVD
ncbi:MAG: hypothetical protein HQM07_05555 [Zetaproteobacteria bacterium]|nr:hypothetical protein [Zetaproteobacteria bacterium]